MSTPLLGLALPADGTTNWGTLVNTSITALLDSAVAGTTTLTSDADATLTTTAEASNQARQFVLLCTGSRAAIRKIIAPAQSKTYVVINNTTGGFGVTICGVGPTVGVTVPSGKTFFVAWNGSDFVVVGVAAVNLTTDVTGVLPAANGGTGVANNNAATVTSSGNFAYTRTLTGTTNVTFPTTGTLATLAGSETLTNKLISGVNNTLVNIANASLTNSAITINGNSVALGGSITVTAANPSALTIGTGLSGGSYNGSSAVTVAIDSTVATLTGAQTLTNKTLTSPTLISPALGTPASGNLANCTFPTLNQNTTGNAATATNPQSGGSFITSSNIGSQSVAFATNATNATNATTATNATNAVNATNATNATTAATVSTTVASGATGTTQANGDNSTRIATTAYVQNAVTTYSIYAGESDTASKTMNVILTPGTWQLVCSATFGLSDPGNYDFTNTATAVSNATTATASVRLVRAGGSGFGRFIYGTSMGVQTLTISTTTSTTLVLGVPTINGGSVYARSGILTKIA